MRNKTRDVFEQEGPERAAGVAWGPRLKTDGRTTPAKSLTMKWNCSFASAFPFALPPMKEEGGGDGLAEGDGGEVAIPPHIPAMLEERL